MVADSPPGCIRTQQRLERILEVSSRNSLEVKPWDQLFHGLRSTKISRQDLAGELLNALKAFLDAGPGLLHWYGTDTRLTGAFRAVAIPDRGWRPIQ